MNSGLGPAILEEISVLYNDNTYVLDHINFYNQYKDTIENDFEYDRFSYANINPGRVIPAGETVNLLQSTRPDGKIMDPFDSLFTHGAELIIKYSSVYEQMWEIKRFNALPTIINEEPKVIQSMLD